MKEKRLQVYLFVACCLASVIAYLLGIQVWAESFFIGLSVYVVLGYGYVIRQSLRLTPKEILDIVTNTWLAKGRKPHKPSYTYLIMQISAVQKTTIFLLVLSGLCLFVMSLLKGSAYAMLFSLFLFIGGFALLAAVDSLAVKHITSKMAEADALFVQGVYYIDTYD